MDIYSYISNRVWEVKRNNSSGRYDGKKQLNRYTQSYVYSLYHTWFRIRQTPSEGNIPVYGAIVVSDYLVTYHSSKDRVALILYDYMPLKDVAKLLFNAMVASAAVLTARLTQYSTKIRKKANEAFVYLKKVFGAVSKFTNDFVKAVVNFLKTAPQLIILLIAPLLLCLLGVALACA